MKTLLFIALLLVIGTALCDELERSERVIQVNTTTNLTLTCGSSPERVVIKLPKPISNGPAKGQLEKSYVLQPGSVHKVTIVISEKDSFIRAVREK